MKLTASLSNAYEFACHSKACAPPPAGHGGSDKGGRRTTLKAHSTPEFIDTGRARHYSGMEDTRGPGHRHLKMAGETGHTKAVIDKVLGVEKYPNQPGRGRTVKSLSKRTPAPKAVSRSGGTLSNPTMFPLAKYVAMKRRAARQ